MKYSVPLGYADDCVVALALALAEAKQKTVEIFVVWVVIVSHVVMMTAHRSVTAHTSFSILTVVILTRSMPRQHALWSGLTFDVKRINLPFQ